VSIEGKDRPNGCETCREPGLLLWLAAGTLEESESARVEESARRCVACRKRLEETESLARVVRSASPPLVSLSPEELVRIAAGPVDESVVASLSVDDREILKVLRSVDADLEAWERRPRWRERAFGSLAALVPAPGASLTAWLRSPAIAYVALLALAYPAYRGLVGGHRPGEEPAPIVLSAPLGIDGPNRGERTPAIIVGERTSPRVITVFVPVDERYRYRLEILDSRGRSRFVRDDAQTFDAYGTFAVMLPEGFLAAGEYELRVDELDEGGRLVEAFRFPFVVQR
jgi:hypothetical protein